MTDIPDRVMDATIRDAPINCHTCGQLTMRGEFRIFTPEDPTDNFVEICMWCRMPLSDINLFWWER